jgi:hypothetical protein
MEAPNYIRTSDLNALIRTTAVGGRPRRHRRGGADRSSRLPLNAPLLGASRSDS